MANHGGPGGPGDGGPAARASTHSSNARRPRDKRKRIRIGSGLTCAAQQSILAMMLVTTRSVRCMDRRGKHYKKKHLHPTTDDASDMWCSCTTSSMSMRVDPAKRAHVVRTPRPMHAGHAKSIDFSAKAWPNTMIHSTTAIKKTETVVRERFWERSIHRETGHTRIARHARIDAPSDA